MMEGLSADSEEKHEPASDIDTALMDSLKVLDPEGPIREGGAEGADQQDRPQRCARYRSDDPGGTVPSGACEDAPQSETANAADPSQASAVEGHRHRERSARYFAQFRPQGRNGWQGEVRGPHPGACRESPRLGGTGGTAAHRPAGATRTDRHPAPPLAGYRPGG